MGIMLKYRKQLSLPMLVLMGLLLACSPSVNLSTQTAPPKNMPSETIEVPTPESTNGLCDVLPPWKMEFSFAGGFAGLRQTLHLASDGTFTAKDDKLGITIEKSISANEADEILVLLKEACPNMEVTSLLADCADCFQQNFELSSTKANLQIATNDISLPESGFKALFDSLAKLLSETLYEE